MSKFDVIIVGGGMVGLALANALLPSGLSIAVVEAHDFTQQNNQAGVRVSAINYRSQQFLQSLQAWPAQIASRYDKMHVWDENTQSSITLTAAEVGEPALGYIVDNHEIQLALYQALSSQVQCTWLCPDRCVNLIRLADAWQVDLASGKQLQSKLLIGADGANSWIRETVGIQTKPVRYNQQAVVCTVNTEISHEHTAWQRFLKEGPLAFLPLPNQHACSIVWTVPEEKAIELCQMTENEFNVLFTKAFDLKLGQVSVTSTRLHFPLQYQHAKSYTMPGLAIIGDAAHSIHPLAGQGVNLGFADAIELSEVISKAVKLKRPFMSLATLQQYERARRGSNALMMQSMTGFNALFSNDHPALISLRGLGLSLVDKCKPVKKLFIKKAMGLS